jgi:hypothetical protein
VSRIAREPPTSGAGGWPHRPDRERVWAHATLFSDRLREELGSRSTHAFAIEIGMRPDVLYAILERKVWPSAHDVAFLELSLGVSLWPEIGAN